MRGLPDLAPSASFPSFLCGGRAVGPVHVGPHQPGDGAVFARPGFVCGVQNVAGAPHHEAPGRDAPTPESMGQWQHRCPHTRQSTSVSSRNGHGSSHCSLGKQTGDKLWSAGLRGLPRSGEEGEAASADQAQLPLCTKNVWSCNFVCEPAAVPGGPRLLVLPPCPSLRLTVVLETLARLRLTGNVAGVCESGGSHLEHCAG